MISDVNSVFYKNSHKHNLKILHTKQLQSACFGASKILRKTTWIVFSHFQQALEQQYDVFKQSIHVEKWFVVSLKIFFFAFILHHNINRLNHKTLSPISNLIVHALNGKTKNSFQLFACFQTPWTVFAHETFVFFLMINWVLCAWKQYSRSLFSPIKQVPISELVELDFSKSAEFY
jgi:hypothetical protein